MQQPPVFIGVDVSKQELVIAIHGQPGVQIVANEPEQIARWLQQLPAHACVAMESTGAYHGLLAQMAHQAKLCVYVLNARDVFYYARALGARAKTDQVDAATIARYLAEHQQHLHAWQPASQAQHKIQQLLARRALLVKQSTAIRLALKGTDIESQAQESLRRAFEDVLKAIDRQVQAALNSDARMAQGYRLLNTITGIGPQTAALLTALFARMPFANADALVAYSGLDPRANDSGSRHGRRRLSKKGSSLLRRQVYLVGFAASRSKTLGPMYKALRANGRSSTESFVILGRKLLRVAFAIWRSGQPFELSKLGLPST